MPLIHSNTIILKQRLNLIYSLLPRSLYPQNLINLPNMITCRFHKINPRRNHNLLQPLALNQNLQLNISLVSFFSLNRDPISLGDALDQNLPQILFNFLHLE